MILHHQLTKSASVNSSSLSSALLLTNFITSLFNNVQDVPPVTPLESYDFIIVGAGVAGCIVANRLSEIPGWNILLLEAGGEEPDAASVPAFYLYAMNSSIDWAYRTEDICGENQCLFSSGKVLGGGSVINGMAYNRGNKHIFDRWAEIGNPGWSYKEILPYFKKSENNRDAIIAQNARYHGTGGFRSVQRFSYQDINVDAWLQAAAELGYPETDINGETQYGYMLHQATIKNDWRHSCNKAFIAPIRYVRHNLHVLTHAYVTKLLIDPHSKVVYGVQYVNKDNRTVLVHATKEVIVCAGAIRSPHILQLSGVGPAQLLTNFGINVINNLPVGENIVDHVVVGMPASLDRSARLCDLENIISQVMNRDDETLKRFASLVTLYTDSNMNEQSNIPDIQHMFASFLNSSIDLRILGCYNTVIFSSFLVQPKSRGYVRINSTDPFISPTFRFNYLSESNELEALVDGLLVGMELAQTSSFMLLNVTLIPLNRCAHLMNDLREYLRCVVRWSHVAGIHAMSSCKMGPSFDPQAVVDPRLKVHGLLGVRVVDASIIPFPVNSNTQAVTMMIGEKASDMIKKDWLD